MRHLVLLILALASCDLCPAAIAIHRERCQNGDADECAWIDQHATAAGTCR